ncbi:MAG: type II toxin-antitoxin system VapC family toxin [Gemmatimonadota bacterium]
MGALTALVCDSSVLLEILLRTGRADPVAALIEDEIADLHVPALCDIEVVSAVRRLSRMGFLPGDRGDGVVEDYLDLPLIRHGHTALLERILALRENFSAYDATYVALAERLSAPLATRDARLIRATRRHTDLALL